MNVYMPDFGMLTIIDTYLNDDRPWLNIASNKNKALYSHACRYYRGILEKVDKDVFVLEGKYIIDFNSFCCELGQGLFGKLGYIGECNWTMEIRLTEIINKNDEINITWNDSKFS